jgi:site-specific DNA recombinase
MARRKPRPPGTKAPGPAESSREAIGIVRCSTQKQGDGMSPDVQENGIAEYARRKSLNVATRRVFESGKDSAARPQYQDALVEARLKGNIIFWVWDRTGRNLTDHEQLEREVRAGKFRVHIASENRIYDHNTPDTDWFAADVNKATHKQYSRDQRRRALEGGQAKADAGEYPAKPPLGYINAPRLGPDGQLIRRGSRIVKLGWCDRLFLRMLELRLSGASFKVVAATVASEGLGVPPDRLAPFARPAGATKAELLLKNPFYVGKFEWNHGTYEGTHEPVFSAAQWEALQATFNGPAAPLRIVKRDAALAGFLKCAQCGCSITYDPKKRGERVYHYYRCANGKKQHQKLVYVSEADILDGFASAAEAIAIDTVIAEELARILNETHADVRAQRKRDSDRFRRELAALEPQEDQLMDLLVGGSIDDAAYKRKLQRIREQRADLAQKLEQASERLDDAHLETVRSTLELAKRAKLQWAERSAVEKRRFLELVLSNAQLDGGTVRYTLRKPFAILAEMRGSADWRTREDSNFRPSDS